MKLATTADNKKPKIIAPNETLTFSILPINQKRNGNKNIPNKPPTIHNGNPPSPIFGLFKEGNI